MTTLVSGSPPVQIFVYRPLLKYLDQRFADTVVLTFSEIEAILGFPLPADASREAQWWMDGGDPPSVQSAAWTNADRTAIANLRARSVSFSRAAEKRTTPKASS